MVRKTKEESDRTYHALLDAALGLFNEQGTTNTTLNDIAKEVNMTRGAVYWHFQNKDDIIIALWNRDAHKVLVQFARDMHLDGATDPVKQFRGATLRWVRSLIEQRNVYQVFRVIFNSMELTSNERELQKFLRHTGSRFYDAIVVGCRYLAENGRLKPNLSVRHTALGLWSYMNGIVQLSSPNGMTEVNLAEDGESLLNIYLDAVLDAQNAG